MNALEHEVYVEGQEAVDLLEQSHPTKADMEFINQTNAKMKSMVSTADRTFVNLSAKLDLLIREYTEDDYDD